MCEHLGPFPDTLPREGPHISECNTWVARVGVGLWHRCPGPEVGEREYAGASAPHLPGRTWASCHLSAGAQADGRAC